MLVYSCSSATAPCPSGSEVWVSTATMVDPADFGITTSEIQYVYLWGFASVLSAFLLGLGVSYAIGIIRKI